MKAVTRTLLVSARSEAHDAADQSKAREGDTREREREKSKERQTTAKQNAERRPTTTHCLSLLGAKTNTTTVTLMVRLIQHIVISHRLAINVFEHHSTSRRRTMVPDCRDTVNKTLNTHVAY